MYINLYYVHPIPSDTQNAFYSGSPCVEPLSFHHCVIDVLVDDGFGAVLAQGDKWIPKKGRSLTKDNKADLCWRTTQSRKPGTSRGVFVWKWCSAYRIPPNCYFNSDTDTDFVTMGFGLLVPYIFSKAMFIKGWAPDITAELVAAPSLVLLRPECLWSPGHATIVVLRRFLPRI
jgi:hypothetical protein